MKISIISMVGNEKMPIKDSKDAWREAIDCWNDLADEVIVIRGDQSDGYSYTELNNVKHFGMPWSYEWSWEELPKHLNAGYKEATGDWVIRCDFDYFFHENDIKKIRRELEQLKSYDVATLQKHVFITKNRYYQKGATPIAINKGKVGDSYGFGQAINQKTDLCYPIKIAGKNDKGIPQGHYLPDKFGKCRQPFYVYDYTFAEKEQTIQEFWRFAKAYQRYFGNWAFGDTKKKAFKIFMDMMAGRSKKCVYKVGESNSIKDHPKYIRKKIDRIKPEQFGYNHWGTSKFIW